MDVLNLLPIAFLIGMGHALEADHMAAMATMVADNPRKKTLILRGTMWGLGHTFSLFLICGTVFLLGLTISIQFEHMLELIVGVMVAGLGLQCLWRLRKGKVHIHAHEHEGFKHIHVHTHLKSESDPQNSSDDHRQVDHTHRHPSNVINAKAVLVGCIHGVAGSGALLVLTLATTDSASQALSYFLVFGLGSIIGMATLSLIATFPLSVLQRCGKGFQNAIMLAIAFVAFYIGSSLALDSIRALTASV
ncbi:MAG: high frequency lysogenization protein HflD [Gammaproteobacteria bacterium]|nr:high frequency lysogenization protein HflD [Gammaproteobacteria bacterium]